MKLNAKVTLFSTVLTFVMVSVIVIVSFISFRQFVFDTEKEHIQSVAELVHSILTETMSHSAMHEREMILQRIGQMESMQGVHIMRSPDVKRQYGEAKFGAVADDAIDREVLKSGKPFFGIVEENGKEIVRGTLPFLAEKECGQCHERSFDSPALGAITINMSMENMLHDAHKMAVMVSLSICFFMMVMFFFVRRLLEPVIQTAHDVQESVNRAVQGDFQANIKSRSDDEIGQVANDLNNLLMFVRQGLSTISQDVAQLMQHSPPSEHENLLNSTIRRVEGLIDAAHFRQSIEEDESKLEICQRLIDELTGRFSVNFFSIYEVDREKNHMVPLAVDGAMNASCRWCSQEILMQGDKCRAKRTGHSIDGLATSGICHSFQPPDEVSGVGHVCIPIIQAGVVGSVVQIIVPLEDSERVQTLLPYLNVYLREAAPVMEAKRLMDTLRASSLTDSMTGLHNRRFLEEYAETLVESASRRHSQISLLMLDLDYFKMVNDNFGHDAGDMVLKAIAKVMRSSVRSSDLVIRIGGEEFLIVLLDTQERYAEQVAEKIRATVESLKIQLPGAAVIQKTISIGISEIPIDSEIFWQAVKYADVALYRAKESGRNRVVRFLPDMWKEEVAY